MAVSAQLQSEVKGALTQCQAGGGLDLFCQIPIFNNDFRRSAPSPDRDAKMNPYL